MEQLTTTEHIYVLFNFLEPLTRLNLTIINEHRRKKSIYTKHIKDLFNLMRKIKYITSHQKKQLKEIIEHWTGGNRRPFQLHVLFIDLLNFIDDISDLTGLNKIFTHTIENYKAERLMREEEADILELIYYRQSIKHQQKLTADIYELDAEKMPILHITPHKMPIY